MHRTLIISDVHLRWRQVEEMLSWERYDKLILTGDFFDGYEETTQQNVDTAVWLKAKLADPRTVACIGNHDMQHLWPDNPWVRFDDNGYGPAAKHMYVARVLTDTDRRKLVPYHIDQGILFSHAGFDAYLPAQLHSAGCQAPGGALTVEGIAAYINALWPKVCERYAANSIHPLMEAGRCRGGMQVVGGLCWRDFGSFMPVAGIGQIFGHSIQDGDPLFRIINRNGAPMWRRTTKGVNPRWLANGWGLCMDTCNKHYAILEGDVLTIKRVHWHRAAGLDATGIPRAIVHHKAPWTVSPTASREDVVIHLKEPPHA